MLTRRPDLEAAWQQVEAAGARVDVARAERLPLINLTGSYGRQSSALEDLVKSGFDVWALFGRLAQPLFDAGSREAAEGIRRAQQEQALATYQGRALVAFAEVENALDAEQRLAREEAEVASALEAARQAEQTTREDYENGLVEILSLLQVQRRVFTTEERLINLQNARRQNRVRLGLALGVGVPDE